MTVYDTSVVIDKARKGEYIDGDNNSYNAS